jgi:curli biogenesis system outer membrane secretion channel CsgG
MRSTCPVMALLLLLAATLATVPKAHAQGITDMKKGDGTNAVQGSTGPSGTQNVASDLERCDKPMGAVAVVEPQDYVGRALAKYQLGSPVGLIRLMVQQSNCFIVVERGMGMKNMMQERALDKSGELRQDSNMGGGQMVSADYILTPGVAFSENNAGGVGGGLGGLGALFGRGGAAVGAIGGTVAGGLKFKEAQTSMLLADSRSGIQVAAAEGNASKADFRLGGFLGGVGAGVAAGAGLGGYSNTNEGKVIAASFADNYNGIVRAVRANPSLQRNVGTLSQEAAAGGQKKGGSVFNEGDVLRPKIGNVRIMSKPSDAGQVVTTLGKGEEMIFLGKEEEGFLQVESGKGSGWVKKILLAR